MTNRDDIIPVMTVTKRRVSRRTLLGRSALAGAAGVLAHFLPSAVDNLTPVAYAGVCDNSQCTTNLYQYFCGLGVCGCSPCVGGVRVRVTISRSGCPGGSEGPFDCCCPSCNAGPICGPCDGRFLGVANFCG